MLRAIMFYDDGIIPNPNRRWWQFWKPRKVRDPQWQAKVFKIVDDTLPLKINRITSAKQKPSPHGAYDNPHNPRSAR